jgi:mRNA-degrading endonuclease toxin of MazEF toxin-antitoxin module
LQKPGNPAPKEGEIWDVHLGTTISPEQSGLRPVLVLFNDWFNDTENYLFVVLPITATDRGISTQLKISGREGGLSKHSIIMCEQIRAISIRRFVNNRGTVSEHTLSQARRIVNLCIGDNPVNPMT